MTADNFLKGIKNHNETYLYLLNICELRFFLKTLRYGILHLTFDNLEKIAKNIIPTVTPYLYLIIVSKNIKVSDGICKTYDNPTLFLKEGLSFTTGYRGCIFSRVLPFYE
jgi:hypothetical protein